MKYSYQDLVCKLRLSITLRLITPPGAAITPWLSLGLLELTVQDLKPSPSLFGESLCRNLLSYQHMEGSLVLEPLQHEERQSVDDDAHQADAADSPALDVIRVVETHRRRPLPEEELVRICFVQSFSASANDRINRSKIYQGPKVHRERRREHLLILSAGVDPLSLADSTETAMRAGQTYQTGVAYLLCRVENRDCSMNFALPCVYPSLRTPVQGL